MENFNNVPSTGTFGESIAVVNENFLLAQQKMEELQALYNALQQTEPEVIEPSDTWPVANPEEGVIYRVIDRVNTPPQYYSDYMWNGTSMVQMAQYNNAIDDEPTPGSNNLVKSGGVAANIVYDISAAHSGTTYADLASALGTNGANVPVAVRKGGMSVKFVQSSDNKYVQYRYMGTATTGSPNPFLDTTNWQGVTNDVKTGSKDLVESGGVDVELKKLNYKIGKTPLPWEPGYIDMGSYSIGDVVDLTNIYYGDTTRHHSIVDVQEGDIFILNGYTGTSARIWVFLDADNKLVDESGTSGTFVNTQIIVPSGVSKVMITAGVSADESYYESISSLESNFEKLRAENVYIDMDRTVPLSSGYYTPATARVAVPIISRKYGVIIQYKTSALSMRIEQFIDNSSGYNGLDKCWRTLYPFVNNKTNYCLDAIVSIGYKVNNGSIISDSTRDYCFFVVFENTTYICTDTIASIEYFYGPTNVLSANMLTGNFISHDEIESTTFTTPSGCCLVALNFTHRNKERYKNIFILMQSEVLNRELYLQRNNQVLGALRFTEYLEAQTSYNLNTGDRGISTTYDSIIIPVIGRESYVVRNRYGQNSNVQGVLFFNGTPGSYTFIESYNTNTYNESDILIAPETAKYIVFLMIHRNNGNFDEIYLVKGFSVNPLVSRFSGPCFTEYRNMGALNNSRVSVGMLGNTEANLSFNMDYRTGVHKAYDPTVGAIWLALSGSGGAFQYAAANQPTDGDIWESDGYRYALWFSSRQFAVNTDMNDPKGNAAIWGKRQDNQITFAGHTDCVIEGNRIKGTSGAVFINTYNDGKVIIANGGGRTLIGGVADDNTSKLQVHGVCSSQQYKLSDLNTAPASATAPGTKGEIRITEDYIYVCIATNTWVRAALATW